MINGIRKDRLLEIENSQHEITLTPQERDFFISYLKRNDFLEQENKELRGKYIAYKEELETMRMSYKVGSQKLCKLEKAIEICKKKLVDFNLIRTKNDAQEYNLVMHVRFSISRDMWLTEEEFNLLKEVFRNE